MLSEKDINSKLKCHLKDVLKDSYVLLCDTCYELDDTEEGKFCYKCDFQVCKNCIEDNVWSDITNINREEVDYLRLHEMDIKHYTVSLCNKCV